MQSLVARKRGVEAAYVGGRGPIAPDRGHGEAVQRLAGLGRVRDVRSVVTAPAGSRSNSRSQARRLSVVSIASTCSSR